MVTLYGIQQVVLRLKLGIVKHTLVEPFGDFHVSWQIWMSNHGLSSPGEVRYFKIRGLYIHGDNCHHLSKIAIRAAHWRPNYSNVGSHERKPMGQAKSFLLTTVTRVGGPTLTPMRKNMRI